MNAKDFLKEIENKNYIERDKLCCEYAINNKCSLNNFKPISIKQNGNELTYLVSNNYLSFDDIIIPLSGPEAQKFMDKFYCTLPTKKMVDQIWQQSEVKVKQIAKGAPHDASMYSIKEIIRNSDLINKELEGKDKTKLIGGHKKDVVLTNKLAPNNPKKRVAIYGWHGTNGKPIQGPGVQASVHESSYYDYSHAIRIISRDCTLNGKIIDILEILTGEFSYLLSDEGKLAFTRY